MFEEVIRQPLFEEHHSVRAVVQTVVDEVYGGLWAPPPLPIDEDCWLMSWVAVVDTKIVGVALTHEQWLNDLWVLHDSRGYGIGQRLLARAEAEMVGRGYQVPPAACCSIERKGYQVLPQGGLANCSAVPARKVPGDYAGDGQIFPQGEAMIGH
jgi:GNAT superfamily N-acetyltransferase